MSTSTSAHGTRDHSHSMGHIFQSVKTTEAIMYRERWHLIWLLRLSLDRTISNIKQSSQVPGFDHHHLAVETVDTRGHVSVRVCSVHGMARTSDGSLPFDCVVDTKSKVVSGPGRATLLAIWSVRYMKMCLDDRLQILDILDQDGEQSIKSISNQLKKDTVSTSKIVLALVFEGSAWIDIDRPLSFETLVSSPSGNRVAADWILTADGDMQNKSIE